MCWPTGVRIKLSLATLKKWRLTKADVTKRFLQTGKGQKEVLVIPRQSPDKGFVWLLLTLA